ncbi:purine-nucleoside phosphorylase [Actinomyces sp. ZJ308]|uniref:purine-nucleoside phosphorylase n=1 Tax=Actinomyces sp. ZJ308 TaxID=2708342 RepID=UPI00141F732B|nr:purine-nucleoside phosphorylase [Actinomyces sp. ZJ308]
MAQQPAPPGTWDEDPDGASILLATGRARHDLLIIAEPAFLRDLDQAWGRPAARVRLSFLPGVHAPGAPGQEDALMSYERGGLGVLVARGRTSLFEGESARSTTALARIASGARLRAALLITRATPLAGSGGASSAGAGGAAPGQVRVVADHLNLSGGPLFPATGMVSASWDATLAERLGRLRGVSGSAVVALVPGPLRPSPAESRVLAAMGAEAAVTDSVAEAMALASRGVSVSALTYLDAPAAGGNLGQAQLSLRQASGVTLAAVEEVLRSLQAGA